MPLKIRCPNAACAKILSVKDSLAGKKCVCPACSMAFLVPDPSAAAATPSAPPAPAPPPVEEDVVVLEPEPEEASPRPPRRTRSEREFEDEDEDDFDDRDDPRRAAKLRSRRRGRARIALLLLTIAGWLYVGAMGVYLLLNLLLSFGLTVDGDFFLLAALPGLGNWVLGIIGLSFLVAGPPQRAARGLAIAALAVAAFHLLTLFVYAFGLESKSSMGVTVAGSNRWVVMGSALPHTVWTIYPLFADAIKYVWPIVLIGLMELARWILLLLQIRALGKALNQDLEADQAMKQVIVVPSTLGVLLVIDIIFG